MISIQWLCFALSGIYFLARILVGGASFAIIAAYTRLLNAQEFGELSLALAGVGLFSVLIIEGPMLAMLRCLTGSFGDGPEPQR